MVRTRLNIGCRYSTPVRKRPLHPTRSQFKPEASQTQAPVSPATEPGRRAGGGLTTISVTALYLGVFIRTQILEELTLSISCARDILFVRRATLSYLTNERTGLSPEMAVTVEKAASVYRWTRGRACTHGTTVSRRSVVPARFTSSATPDAAAKDRPIDDGAITLIGHRQDRRKLP